MIFNFILDSSAFQKGLGNITLWTELQHPDVLVNVYIPVFTIQELDFQRFRRKSFVAKKALHFIDALQERDHFKMQLEYPELNEAISWNETLKLAQPKPSAQQAIPIRFKKLLKSCYYKCHYQPDTGAVADSEDRGWVLVTEDETVRALAEQFQIPAISMVDADSIINSHVKDKSFVVNKRFSKKLMEKSNNVKQQDGKPIYVTSFDDEFLAPRSKGELWTPGKRNTNGSRPSD